MLEPAQTRERRVFGPSLQPQGLLRKADAPERNSCREKYTIGELHDENKELLYAVLDEVWMKLSIPEKEQKRLLEQHGVPSDDIKIKLMQNWIKKTGSSQDAKKILELKLLDVFGNEVKLEYKSDLSRDIVESIPDDAWIKFLRCCLELPETEIKEFRRQCKFTQEQKYQLILTYGKDVVVSRKNTWKKLIVSTNIVI